jgi:hypothetical protein
MKTIDGHSRGEYFTAPGVPAARIDGGLRLRRARDQKGFCRVIRKCYPKVLKMLGRLIEGMVTSTVVCGLGGLYLACSRPSVNDGHF